MYKFANKNIKVQIQLQKKNIIVNNIVVVKRKRDKCQINKKESHNATGRKMYHVEE